jgi:HSP20 family protein
MQNRELTSWGRSPGPAPLAHDPFTGFRREMDRLFNDFFAPTESRSFGAAPAASAAWPSIDVNEADQAYTVTAEVPGLEEQDLELNLRDNVLTIRGEKRQEHKEEERGRTYAERFYGRFQRTIPFDAEIDADKVEATFKNGILTVNLPKNAETREKSRKIEIRPQHG